MPRKPAGVSGRLLVTSRRIAVVGSGANAIVAGSPAEAGQVTRTGATGRQRAPSQAETAMVAGRACWASTRNHARSPSTGRFAGQDSDTQSAGRAALICGSSGVAGWTYASDQAVPGSLSTIAAGGGCSAPEKRAAAPVGGAGTGDGRPPGGEQGTGAGARAPAGPAAGRPGIVGPPVGRP